MSKADETEIALRRARMKAALEGKPLTPDVTQDEIDTEIPADTSREAEFKNNRPPHHG
jgi:hypothetical protein